MPRLRPDSHSLQVRGRCSTFESARWFRSNCLDHETRGIKRRTRKAVGMLCAGRVFGRILSRTISLRPGACGNSRDHAMEFDRRRHGFEFQFIRNAPESSVLVVPHVLANPLLNRTARSFHSSISACGRPITAAI